MEGRGIMDIREALLYKKILGGGGVPQQQIDEIAIAIGLATPSNVENILNELDEIIANSNQTTGETDTTLTDAVQSLINGYGQGGGDCFWEINTSNQPVLVTENMVFPDVSPEKPFFVGSLVGGLSPYSGIYGIKTLYVGSGWRRTTERAGTFRDCRGLEKVVLAMPETSYDMFWGCTALKSVELLPTVETIAGLMCEGCTSLEEIVVSGDSIKTLSASTILNGANSSAKIYVPDNLVDAYKSATNWSAYASRIFQMSSRPS